MADKRRVRRHSFLNMLELPAETMINSSCVTLTSGSEALITGCRRVREYQSDLVRLTLCDGELTVSGDGLTMRAFFGSQIQIRGRISEVRFG